MSDAIDKSELSEIEIERLRIKEVADASRKWLKSLEAEQKKLASNQKDIVEVLKAMAEHLEETSPPDRGKARHITTLVNGLCVKHKLSGPQRVVRNASGGIAFNGDEALEPTFEELPEEDTRSFLQKVHDYILYRM